MHQDFQTHSRDEFIEFGQRLGRFLKISGRERPWVICLNGDGVSGKALLALAIDRVWNPDRYPHGITTDMSADDMMEPGPFPPRNVVFNNFGRIIYTDHNFNEKLEVYAEENPAASVLIASNIDRTLTGEFDYRAKGLCSQRLDLALQVHKRPGQFNRHIAVTAEDWVLLRALAFAPHPAQLSFLENNKRPHP